MKLPPLRRSRSIVLVAALAVVATALGWWLASRSDRDEGTAQTPPVAAAPPSPPAALPPGQAPSIDIFAPRTWEPPAPAAPPTATVATGEPTPPPPPEAPPLPFKFLGRVTEPGRKPAFMLDTPERVVVATVGQAIDRTWRFERFTGKELVFRHLPTNTRSTLPIGETSDGGKP